MSTSDVCSMESSATSPLDTAIIGIGCRFPGATCLREFWDVLSKGENHITEVPPDRWVADDFYDSDPDAAGKSYTKRGGFIKNFADFDHKLFGLSESEAVQMDPQQRQVLECTYMALEDAGITRQQISGQKVGVYLGTMNTDYNMRLLHCSDVVDRYSVTGSASSVISNRVSYVFNLTGPSMSIDTACSSSIVAIHQAILGLRAGDCSLAICGGINLLLHPEIFTPLCKARMLSKTGQCHSFSNDADGYTRGEGCGIVILKPTEKALSDCDNIWGTMVTGLNQDGHFAQPITAPSEKQQVKLMKEVFTTYHIDSGTVQYIEAHGTGTRRGDPTEAAAFASFFPDQDEKCYIGSVKTNIGHLEPAAGVASLIKVVLMMKHNTIVPSLHFDKLNELIVSQRFRFVVPKECVPWTNDAKVACLNSFGFGGANSHVVIKNCHDHKLSSDITTNALTSFIVCFSGSTYDSLHKSIVDFLDDPDDFDIRSVAYTSTVRREHFKFRKAWVADTVVNLRQQMQSLIDAKKGQVQPTGRKQIIFVFCGMGTTWRGMCKDLMEFNITFKESIKLIDSSLKRFVSWSLTERFEASYDVDDPAFSPIAIFACQVALTRIWESLGISPETVVGQSVGEVAAAHVAGILSLDEAVRVIYYRTTILSQAVGGKMLLIRNLDTTVVNEMCEKHKDRLNVALYYSPTSCTVSGDCESVMALKEEIARSSAKQSGAEVIELNVTSAFHSHHMSSCQEKLDSALLDLKTNSPRIQMVSSVDSEFTETDLTSSKYWGQNVRQPVHFNSAITKAANGENTIFLEIGPKPVLRGHLKDIFMPDVQPLSASSMSENSKADYLLKTVVLLYENNHTIRWDSFIAQHPSISPAPRYSFDQKTLWKLGVLTGEDFFSSGTGESNHLFLKPSDSSSQCKIHIKPSEFVTAYEHKVKGILVVPGATYAETGFAIVRQLALGNPHATTVSVKFSTPVTLKKGNKTVLDVDVSKLSSHETAYIIKHGDVVHAEGAIGTTKELCGEDRIDIHAIKDRCPQYVSGKDVHEMLEQSGFTYGEAFATIDHAFRGEGESLTALRISPKLRKEVSRTLFHPAVLDGMLQASTVTYFLNGELLPVEVTDLTLRHSLQTEMFAYTKLTQVIGPQASFFLCLFATDGTVLAQIRKFSTKMIVQENFDEKTSTYRKKWLKVDLGKPVETDKTKAVVFTNSTLNGIGKTCKILGLNFLQMNELERMDEVLNDIKQMYFVFEMPSISPSGENLLVEIIKRITPLRLMILYHSDKDLQIPFIIIMERRQCTTSQGIEAATCCLNEATHAFCHCVLREFKSLPLKTVEICTKSKNEFISRLPAAMDHLSCAALTDVLEVKLQGDMAYMYELQSNMNQTPSYRTTSLHDPAVLCSKFHNVVVEPAFFLTSATRLNHERRETELLVSTAVVHSPYLQRVTVQSQPSFGSSEIQTYPILSMEFSGKINSKGKYSDVIACYPAQIKKVINVPRKCILQTSLFPQYQPGYLVMLYTLWAMCSEVKRTTVAILYVSDTEPLAKALYVLLKNTHATSISFIKADEVSENTNAKVVIATVNLTTDVVRKLAEKWGKLENIICLENITDPNAVGALASCYWLKVSIIRPIDIFSQSIMAAAVPDMFQWIKSHPWEMDKLVSLLNECVSLQLMKDAKPIKLTEILQTTPLSLQEEGKSFNLMKTPTAYLVKQSRSYLVVGGLTGLGWECVSYLASKGAGCIIILSRSKPNVERREEMTQLAKANGCIVKSVQTDVTNFKILEATFAKLRKDLVMKPLGGVFYGAAVLRDAMLLDMTAEDLKASLAPKVCGAWNLHILTAHHPLDFFVFHSSVASVLGNSGQANYAAGNGFMDELAQSRRSGGLSGQSINWGPLRLGMLFDHPAVVKRLQSQGYNLIEKKDIRQCLTHLMMLNEAQSAIITIDYRKMADHLVKNKDKVLMGRLKNILEPVMKSIQDMGKGGVRQSFNIEMLKTCSQDERVHKLQMYIRHLSCDKALLDEHSFDMSTELKTQGVDSMYAMEIAADIMSDTGVRVSAHEIQLQSAASLAQSITERLFKTGIVVTEDLDNELVVSKHTILSSAADSFFGFDTNLGFRMSFVIVCTLQMPGGVESMQLRPHLRKCVSLYKLARSACTFTDQLHTVRTLTVDEAFDFRTISGTDASEVQKYKEEPIDLETHGPLRFIFLTETKQLIIVLHKFYFDNRATTVLVNDMLGMSVGRDASESDNEERVQNDVTQEIQRVLAPQYPALLEFWKPKILCLCYSSFRSQTLQQQCHSETDVVVTKTFNSDFYNRITQFTKKQTLTLFEFVVSMYQLYLSFHSNSPTSTVTTSVDLRTSVPSLMDSLGRCANLVPLPCQLADQYATVTEFLNRNKKDLQMFLQNSIFPFREMKKLLSGESVDNLSRHYFILEDDSLTTKQNQLKVEQAVHFDSHTETCLYIWQKKLIHTIDIKFHLNGNLYNASRGRAILDGFGDLLAYTLDHPDVTIDYLKRKHATPRENDQSRKSLCSSCSVM